MPQEYEQSGPSPQTAYILNVILPGAGNIYFGQPIVGTVFVLGILFAVFIGFFGASAAMLGIVIILISVVAAIFTFGLSLLALPIGLVFLMMGGSRAPHRLRDLAVQPDRLGVAGAQQGEPRGDPCMNVARAALLGVCRPRVATFPTQDAFP